MVFGRITGCNFSEWEGEIIKKRKVASLFPTMSYQHNKEHRKEKWDTKNMELSFLWKKGGTVNISEFLFNI